MTQPPRTFGRYSLERKLAQGGMAEIFLARFQGESGFEKKVIIKRILPRFSQNQDFIRMLVHEAKIAVRLHHANIVQIFDLGRVGESYFISMEYVKGKDLRTILSRLKGREALLPQEISVFIAREACKGLEYAHSIVDEEGQSLNLVHRDISPPNILLSLDGEVKIIDFGIAKATARATDTQAGVFKGKFSYMSPEQARGQKVDRRTDIFANGLCLYEMLIGQKLLDGETDVETLERAKNIDRLDLGLKEAGVPSELERIVRRALAGDRDKRYQTSGEMARELSVYLNVKYPTFTEQEAAAFMRQLFGLDRRGLGGTDNGDPDAALAMSLVGTFGDMDDLDPGGSSSTTENLAQTGSTGRRLKDANLKRTGAQLASATDEDVAFLDDLLEPDGPGPEGGEGAVSAQGWASEIASRWDTSDAGTYRPVMATPNAPVDESVERTLLSGITPIPGQVRESTGIHDKGGVSGFVVSVGILLALVVLGLGTLVFMPRGNAEGLPAALQEMRHDGRRVLGLPTLAEVAVTIAPSGGQIYIGDALRHTATSGDAPVTLTLAVGERHTLDIRAEGFDPETLTVAPEREFQRLAVSVDLRPIVPVGQGRLRVESTPPGAALEIAGAPIEGRQTPMEVEALQTDAPLALVLKLDNYKTWTGEVTPHAGSVETIHAILEPQPVRLSLSSEPVGAQVYLDDRLYGKTPLADPLLLLPDSTYSLRVEREGYQGYSQPLKTILGENLNVSVSLSPLARTPEPKAGPAPKPATPKPATPSTAVAATEPAPVAASEPAPAANRALVSIVVIPQSPPTMIYVDGVELGLSPVKGHALVPGDYIVRLKNQDRGVDRTLPKRIRSDDVGRPLTWEFEIAAP